MTKHILTTTEVAELPKSSIVALWNDMADGDNPPLNAKNVSKEASLDLALRVHARAAELGYCVLETDGGIELAVVGEVGPTDDDRGAELSITAEEAAETQAALDAEPIDPTEDIGGTPEDPFNEQAPGPRVPPQPGAAAFLVAQGVAPAISADKPAKAKRGFSPGPDDQRRIKLLQPLNPKRGKSALRYAQYVDGMTIAEYITACVGKQLVDSGTHCRADIDWDVKRKYIEVLPIQEPTQA